MTQSEIDDIRYHLSHESTYYDKLLKTVSEPRQVFYYKRYLNIAYITGAVRSNDILQEVVDEEDGSTLPVVAVDLKRNSQCTIPSNIELIISELDQDTYIQIDKENPIYKGNLKYGGICSKDGKNLILGNGKIKDGVEHITYLRSFEHDLIIPESVSSIEKIEGGWLHELYIPNPRLDIQEGDFGVDTKVYINTTLSDFLSGNLKKIFLDNFKRRNVVLAAPDLCMTSSDIPGYICVTREIDDHIIQINTKYISCLAPCSFERYHGEVEGTKIYMAPTGNQECNFHIEVYESPKIVSEKIIKALNELGNSVGGLSGLLDKLETLTTIKQK